MNIKNNLVKPVGILAERQFIAKCINRQNNKRFTSFKSVVLQAIALLAVLAFCISFIGLALHFASFHKSKQQLETEALLQQLEKGEVIKLGMKCEQRDGYEYELTVSLEMIHENHIAVPTKDRTKLFNPNGEYISRETGEKLLAWLNDGRSQEEALQAAFDEAIQRINSTNDVAELGIIYSQFKGTDCEAEIISACGSRKQSLVGTQGNA